MAIWQNISETLISEIEAGVLQSGGRLPSDGELAVRFGVHRHTVRRALGDLQARGLVRTERGRGTFVVEDAIDYRLGEQTRFEENLLENTRIPRRRLLAVAEYPAPDEIAGRLSVRAGEDLFVATLLGEADDLPVHLFRAYFSKAAYPDVPRVFAETTRAGFSHLSLVEILEQAGIPYFRRKHVRVRCRLPDMDEARQLKMSPREPVFETSILNVDRQERPVFFGETCMCGSRIEFVMDF